MDKHSYKNILLYLVNFQNNYRYFSITYSGKYLPLYLDQFVHDQLKMAQIVYGDQGAKMVKELADRLASNDGVLN